MEHAVVRCNEICCVALHTMPRSGTGRALISACFPPFNFFWVISINNTYCSAFRLQWHNYNSNTGYEYLPSPTLLASTTTKTHSTKRAGLINVKEDTSRKVADVMKRYLTHNRYATRILMTHRRTSHIYHPPTQIRLQADHIII
jgi:hypothetical protein